MKIRAIIPVLALTSAAMLAACAPQASRSAYISVTATAEARTTPDIAMINAGVQSRGATAKAAQDAQATRMAAVIEVIKAQGVDEKDIQTSQIGLNPVIDYSADGRQRVLGYDSINTVTIKVRDTSKVSALVDGIVADGGNRIDGISFAMDDAADAEADAHAEAVRKARARAEGYAAGAGLKVHRLVSITEPGGTPFNPGPMPVMARDAVSMEAAATPILPGQVTTGAAVTVVFELR
jgi:uncharacterized protein